MQAKLHQIHPVLPVKNVLESLKFYVNKLGFTIAFANDSKQPTYAGIRRDDIEIHLQWHDAKEWDVEVDRPMLRIVTENVDILFQEYNFKNVFNKDTKVRNTDWGTKEFAFYDIDKNGLVFYQNNL
ncbi:catechol 2,3-dioxygenase-like lactoylglutathione lyase family enzyme [Mesoflavibacter sabulilitoris]|uniref:Glyoxalase/bleomycin resistance/extradiol dioxygenase family protein n=2 Tax=Mesoflavibacter TaxID=444051 RepID=A0A2T1NAQ7_9FLAO|nr:VOC family protein [Mesoflavibacter zeaxanthinifaciens]MBB3123667.1 catechol 2,3-dioxygenase-like lactoylglutathione lyase family enzyme [Mesoflavibacter zeaxanthinifaciens subsp. sabulilitoris]MCP4053517.1 glyoxalase/bleomycin resistance/extradiol dioxygenase family protein [Mesoflavibacter sp.]PSG89208.1 glyoxalase/bleomycin resistance/extradiol dioxygenase family protein [Mesoflavibacter zeaxanthinifaciens subsp. sabulilitoris]